MISQLVWLGLKCSNMSLQPMWEMDLLRAAKPKEERRVVYRQTRL